MQEQTITSAKAHYGSLAGRIKVRMAKNEDTDREILKTLVMGSGFRTTGLRWSEVSPYWLLAELDGEVKGCIQVCFGKPIGRIEFLCTDPHVYHRIRAVLVRDLLVAACATMKEFGCEAVIGTVPFEYKSYKKMLKDNGCVVVDSGNIIMKSLSEELY